MRSALAAVYHQRLRIVSQESLVPGFYRLTLSSAAMARTARPGQFVMVTVPGGDDPLLRRPFGVHAAGAGRIALLYAVVGEGTRQLAAKKPGEMLDVLGPLGNGFTLDAARLSERVIIVSGGIGVAPLVFLARTLGRLRPRLLQMTAFLGARTRAQILCEKDFKAAGFQVRIATDDGTRGYKGYVTGALEEVLRGTKDEGGGTIYACGPRAMLVCVARLAEKHGCVVEVSLEEHMACGVGACLGCVIETPRGYQRVCKEGPVFDGRVLIGR